MEKEGVLRREAGIYVCSTIYIYFFLSFFLPSLGLFVACPLPASLQRARKPKPGAHRRGGGDVCVARSQTTLVTHTLVCVYDQRLGGAPSGGCWFFVLCFFLSSEYTTVSHQRNYCRKTRTYYFFRPVCTAVGVFCLFCLLPSRRIIYYTSPSWAVLAPHVPQP